MSTNASTCYHTNNEHIGGIAGEALANNLCVTKRNVGGKVRIMLADADQKPMGSTQLGPFVADESCSFVPAESGEQFRGTYSGTADVNDYMQTTTDGVLIANGTSGSTVVDDGSGNQAFAVMLEKESATLAIFGWL